MSITVLFGVSIFLFGAAAGALLTRLQWMAFKQTVSQELMEQFGSAPSIEWPPTKFGHPDVTTFIAPSVDDPYPASAAAAGGEHISSGIVASPTLKRLLERNQMEISRMLREVQALWSTVGLSGNDPNRPGPSASEDCSDNRQNLQFRYGRWFSPKRVLKPH